MTFEDTMLSVKQLAMAKSVPYCSLKTSASVPTSIPATDTICAMKRRKAAKTYADYLREQPSKLSDFERESRAAEALVRDQRLKKVSRHGRSVVGTSKP
jgi:hypothetical protein